MNIGVTNQQDIAIIDGNLSIVTGIEEIRQLIKQRLLSFQGEWFLNFNQGMPYFQTILKKATTLSAIENIYINTIIQTPGVIDIETFRLDFDPATRRANITFRALTTNGVLDFNTGEQL